jgi:hypothetical protein
VGWSDGSTTGFNVGGHDNPSPGAADHQHGMSAGVAAFRATQRGRFLQLNRTGVPGSACASFGSIISSTMPITG